MTNVEQAAHLIREAILGAELPTEAAIEAAKALDRAGLLAPEQRPPHPNPPMDVHQPAWEFREGEGYPIRSWVSVLGKRIWITDGKGWGESMTMSQAHDLVVALLSAINYKEAQDD